MMRHVGVISEYNPFHGGHAYQLGCLKGAETVVVLMSGCFVQRGEAAVLPPVKRAEAAIGAGADLVLELPFPFAAASGEYFATAGVRAMAALGVDTLAFGTESATREALLVAARESLAADFAAEVGKGARTGGAAAAFVDALQQAGKGTLWQPNDLLGLHYTRAIEKEGLPLEIYPVHREGAGYHSTALDGAYPSATALREAMAKGQDITPFLPTVMGDILKNEIAEGRAPARTEALGTAMLARLRAMEAAGAADGCGIAECGGGLLPRLAAAAWEANSYEGLLQLAKCKKYTDGRVRRALLFLLASVTPDDLTVPPAYLRVLGMNERGRAFLANTRKIRTVPVVSRAAEVAALGEAAARQRHLQQVASGLYALCLPHAPQPREIEALQAYLTLNAQA